MANNKIHPRFDREVFKDHVVVCYSHDLLNAYSVETFDFKKIGTMVHSLRFIRMGHQLFVSGDYGDAIYSWSSPEMLAWMSNLDLQYFIGKCTASPSGVPFRDWSSAQVKKRGVEFIRQLEEDELDEGEVLPPEQSLVPLWEELLKNSVDSEEALSRLLEEDIDTKYFNIIPAKVREDYCMLENAPYSCVETTYWELFFGEDRDFFPAGWVAPYQGIVHHGALAMAFEWVREHPMAFEWHPETLKQCAP